MSSRLVIVLAALVAVLAGVLIALYKVSPPELQIESGILLNQPRQIAEFSLVDHDGAQFDNERLHGRWTVLFPGFTHCPDICPATLGTLSGIYAMLDDEERASLQTIFLSVDPDRDQPDSMKQYVTHFSGDFTGVTGDKDEIDRLARSLAIAYQIVPLDDDGAYTVDHTAALVLISPAGTVAGYIQPPLSPTTIADDLRRLLRSVS